MSKEQTDLLPCPFCGGEMQHRYALWASEGDRDAIIHNVPGGTSCPIEGAFSIDTFDNGVSVAEAWNRRASPSPAGGVQGVKVKPLEWEGNGWPKVADTPFGEYKVWAGKDVWFGHEWVRGMHAPTDEIALLWAQEDYEQRILSALSSQAQTTGGVE